MPRRRKTPQEKKILSYAKDCRNVYGENDKASRKAIPRRKQQQNQNERLKMKAQLNRYVSGDEEVDLTRQKRGGWKKLPDAPLGPRLDWRQTFPTIACGRDMSSDLRRDAEKRLRKSKRLKQ